MFISIITVVYNGERTIRKTIESVLCQEFKDYEYIIVDGLSKDNTVAIANEYEERFDGRLRIYSERDKGIYDAMNKGIKLAKGDYIWLVNADDWIEPNALKNINNYCKNFQGDKRIVTGWMNLFSFETKELIKVGKSSRERYNRACKKLSMGVCHPSTIVPIEVYERIGLYDDRYYIAADMDFIIRCYKEGVKIEFLTISLSNMTLGGISNQFPIKKNLHDIWLRATKFKSNIFSACIYMVISTVKFFIIKIRGAYL